MFSRAHVDLAKEEINNLQRLIRMTHDSANGLRALVPFFNSSHLATVVEQSATQRKLFSVALSKHVVSNRPIHQSDDPILKGVIDSWTGARRLAELHDLTGCLSDAERSETTLAEAYAWAMDTNHRDLKCLLADQAVSLRNQWMHIKSLLKSETGRS